LALIILAGAFELGRYSVYAGHPELAQAEQANAIIARVGKLIQLPTGETPTMATISDAASAKAGQPFLANAANGDVLIVYQNAGVALLYRPSSDKLIAVGPIDTSPQTQSEAQAETPIAPVATSTDDATTTSKN
jgi:hypothetical protein